MYDSGPRVAGGSLLVSRLSILSSLSTSFYRVYNTYCIHNTKCWEVRGPMIHMLTETSIPSHWHTGKFIQSLDNSYRFFKQGNVWYNPKNKKWFLNTVKLNRILFQKGKILVLRVIGVFLPMGVKVGSAWTEKMTS